MKTKKESVIERKGTHNHNFDRGDCETKEVVIQYKRRAQYLVALTKLGKRFENAEFQNYSRNCRKIVLPALPLRKN